MADYTNDVQKLYVAYFSRPADPAGLTFWANQLQNNPNGYQTMSAAFASSAEYRATYANMTSAQVVSTVYQHLFGRPAEQSGIDWWAAKLDSHTISIDNAVTQIAAGAQGSDLFAYNAKVAVSAAFTARIDTDAEKLAYTGDAANHIAEQFLATVKDLESAAVARDPGRIDAVISSIVDGTTGGLGEPGIIGLPNVPPPMM